MSLAFGLVAAGTAVAQQPADPPKFAIKSFEVVGNTLLPQAKIDAAVAPFVGAGREFGDIQRALEALEDAYRQNGWGIVQVTLPEQDITRGVVRFNVLEARVGKITIEGNQFFSDRNIRWSLPFLKEGQTPNSQDLAVNLQMLTEQPAKQTTVLLRSGTKDGEVDATVRIADVKPWSALVSIDNTGTNATGVFRLGAGFQYANLTGHDDAINVQYVTSPTGGHWSDVKIFGAGYHLPLYSLKSSIDVFYGYSNVNSGTVAGLFNVSGSGTIMGARWNYYLPKFADYEHKVWLGFNWNDFHNEVAVAGANLVPDIVTHPVNLTYSGLWRLPTAEMGFYASAVRNLPGGADGGQATFDQTRVNATAGYLLARAGFNYVQQLPYDMQFRAKVGSQTTSDALIPAEQYGIGGPDSVRGFLLRQVANDKGLDGQFEVYSPDFGNAPGLEGIRMRALVFYDWGYVKRNNPLPGEIQSATLSSTGIGLRIAAPRNFTARFDYAHIIDGKNFTDGVGTRTFNFSVSKLF
ncbi:MAG: ShlB/FhaC/HecB family hemolysin secretion/activation protein [Burkholderiales bacterium]